MPFDGTGLSVDRLLANIVAVGSGRGYCSRAEWEPFCSTRLALFVSLISINFI
jgi:hypothetical protein